MSATGRQMTDIRRQKSGSCYLSSAIWFLSSMSQNIVKLARKPTIFHVDTGDTFAEKADNFVVYGVSEACQVVHTDGLVAIISENGDTIALAGLRYIRDINHQLIHAHTADNRDSFAMEQHFGPI